MSRDEDKLIHYKPETDTSLIGGKRARRRQKHSSKRKHNHLSRGCDDESDCSGSTYAGYVVIRQRKIYDEKIGYLSLEHKPGDAYAVFGDAEYYVNGTIRRGRHLTLTFLHSNKSYIQVSRDNNLEQLFEGFTTIFEHIGGVPKKIWFDNACPFVCNVIKGGQEKPVDGFLGFMKHYRFEAAFYNKGSGYEENNDENNSENKVFYYRQNILVPVPRFENIGKLNKDLLLQCEENAKRKHYSKKQTIEELFREDAAALLQLPETVFETAKFIQGRDK